MKAPVVQILGLCLFVCLFSPVPLTALPRLQDIIEIENFVFLDLVDGNPLPLETKEAKILLGKEASWLVAGSVYGFTFEYRPGDRGREIKELFVLNPVEGRVNTRQFETPVFRDGSDCLWGNFVYVLAPHEKRRYQSWYSNIIPESQGTGRAPLILGSEGKIEAHKDAVRSALREYYRSVTPNKPRVLLGSVAISSMPVSGIDGGSYVSTLRVRIRTKSVTGYADY